VARHTPREASKKQQKTKSSDWRELESDSNSEGLIEEREKENVRRLPNDFLFVFFVLFGFSFSSAPQRELKFICSFVLYCVLFFFLLFYRVVFGCFCRAGCGAVLLSLLFFFVVLVRGLS
jgi:hypothetical protein